MRQRGRSSARLEQLERRTLFGAGDVDVTFDADVSANPAPRHVISAADGKTLVIGQHNNEIVFTRHNVDGSLDTSFGQQGVVGDVSLPGFDLPIITGVDAHPDTGRFAISFWNSPNPAGVAVFNADGTLFTTFQQDGTWEAAFALEHIEFQKDGKLLLAGTVRVNEHTRRAVVRRMNLDGALDTTFGVNGETGLSKSRLVGDMELAYDGTIYVSILAHVTDADGNLVEGVRIFRLTRDGAYDTGFAVDSFVDSEGAAIPVDLEVLPDRGIMVLTREFGTTTLRRYNVIGRQDAQYEGEEVRQANEMILDGAGRVLLTREVEVDQDHVETHISRFFDSRGPDGAYGVFGAAVVPGVVNGMAIHRGEDALLLVGTQPEVGGTPFVTRLQGGGGVRPVLNSRGTLHIETYGPGAHTSLWIRKRDGRLVVRYGDDFAQSFAPSRIKRISLWLGHGSDELTIGRGVKGVYAEAGSGEDTIHGGAGDDILSGGDGFDEIFGNDGNDRLSGGIGEDTVFGGAGDDRLFGSDDTDVLDGGVGDDFFDGGWGDDDILGGDGNDSAEVNDESDDNTFTSIETLL